MGTVPWAALLRERVFTERDGTPLQYKHFEKTLRTHKLVFNRPPITNSVITPAPR